MRIFTIIAFFICFVTVNIGFAEEIKPDQNYYSDRIYIKIADNVDLNKDAVVKLQSGNAISIGLYEADALCSKYSVESVGYSFKSRSISDEKYRNKLMSSSNAPDLSKYFILKYSGSYHPTAVVRDFASIEGIEFAELVPIDRFHAMPNDELYENQPFLPQIYAEEAWEIHKGENASEPVIVGICDTGTDWTHPDLRENLHQNLGEDADGDGTVIFYDEETETWVYDPDDINGIDDDGNGFKDDFVGWNFFNDDEGQDNIMTDPHSHGTHVAGLAAGRTNNTTGIAAVSWNVKFIPTSHASNNDRAHVHLGYEGIVYLAERGADVINCSWGGNTSSRTNAASIKYAISLGTILVCSAANSNKDEAMFPASYPGVINVASVGGADKKASYSTYSLAVDLSAPGGDYQAGGALLSTFPDNNYNVMQGTSMASPVTAGMIAYVKSYFPDQSNDDIIKRVLATCDNIDTLNTKYINKLGAGRINMYRAITEENPEFLNELRLDFVAVNPEDISNGNGAIEPGETINLGFTIRNYAHYVTADLCEFTISSSDPDIEIINAVYKGSILADTLTDTPKDFTVKISEGAKTGVIKLKLTIKGFDSEIAIGDEFDFELPVTTGGILVWDAKYNTRGFSGNFISDFLNSQGHTAVYIKDFPATLRGFDAVFLSFGVNADNLEGTQFTERMADSVVSFMQDGGNVYIEGSDAFEYHFENTELNSLFGIDTTYEGDPEIILDTLQGVEGSIYEGLVFNQFGIQRAASPDIYDTDNSGVSAFIHPEYGTVAVQNSGEYGQKSFCSVYPVSEIIDIDNPRSRYEIVARILNFFDIEDSYSVAKFTSDVTTGHAPLTVEFEEDSYKNIAVKTREWDFDSDNVLDSDKKFPSFTFPKPGTHTVNLKVSDGTGRTESNSDIYVFNGESALDFDADSKTSVVTNADELNITGPITLEAWINPRSFGRNYYGRIFDKAKFLFFMTYQNNLRFVLDTENNGEGDYKTGQNSISYNKWQHVAVTYDAVDSVAIYINGEKQILSDDKRATGNVQDNSEHMLYLGNRSDRNRTFDGRIDEARIWNVVRTQKEIRDNLLNELTGNEPGLVGYWKFDEGNGLSSDDSSPNNNKCAVYADWRQGRNEGYIMTVPEDIDACLGSNAEFSIETYEFSDLEFQWFKGETELEEDDKFDSVTTSTLIINNVDADDESEYKCRVNLFGSDIYQTIDPVSLKVIPEIIVVLNNESLISIDEESTLELSAEIDHSYPIDISWIKNGKIIDGANSEKLIINNVAASDSGEYFCRVTDQCNNPIDSKTITVKILTESVTEEFIQFTEFKCSPSVIKDQARISFNLQHDSKIKLELTDINGGKISDIPGFIGKEGANNLNINTGNYQLADGAYIIVLHIDNRSQSLIVIIRK